MDFGKLFLESPSSIYYRSNHNELTAIKPSQQDKQATSSARNLSYHAAAAAAYGLPVVEALRAITLYPARILGVEQRVGSLEVGKDATLLVTDGNPLETPTQVVMAYIQGRAVDLSSRHVQLWKKYSTKYERLQRP